MPTSLRRSMAHRAGGIVAVLWALFQLDGDQLRLVNYLLAENRLLRARLP